MIRILFIVFIIYLVVRYLIRPILMAFVVKSAGKMMQDMQRRSQGGTTNPPPPAPAKKGKNTPGEYIDYEEVK